MTSVVKHSRRRKRQLHVFRQIFIHFHINSGICNWKHRVIDWRNDEYSGLVNITLHKGEKKLDWDERDELLRKEKEIALDWSRNELSPHPKVMNIRFSQLFAKFTPRGVEVPQPVNFWLKRLGLQS